ncbi:hypothetical protein [Undibacterium squillarum]|uniref:Beta-lactamase n=1 Tax=Undibacterium squillarum TaxID=1131567 RepID=A0ABQ2Y1C7_9BURK|nr:hypothetical protein [Undibacterium squillarum]GGX48246.1 hypothetical protein GCM10010946_28510 [Undibacterium squillarum]
MTHRWAHEQFTFITNRNWFKQEDKSQDGRLHLYCPETGSSLVLSMDAMDIPDDRMESVARFVLEARKRAHVEGIQELNGNKEVPVLEYDGERVAKHPTANAWEIGYEGTQPGRSFFGFMGFVTNAKVVSLFVITPFSYGDGCRNMFREVVGGFSVTIP